MTIPKLRIGDLTVPLPIVQGGMGVGISRSGLASAVANEGGVGVIAAAMPGISEPDARTDPGGANIRALQREIRQARKKSTGVLGINIMVAMTDYGSMVETAIGEGVDIIFSGAGLPLDMPSYLSNGSKTKLVPIISSGRAAMILCKKWLNKYDYLPDAFVVEGPKAGGHLGFKAEQLEDPAFALENLVRDAVEAVKAFEIKYERRIPIIAAGGIYTGEDIRKFLDMGAAGVQMGTRFVATYECDADEAFKKAYIVAKKEDIVVIKSPVGMPGRAILNDFIIHVNNGAKKPFRCPYHCIKTCECEESPYCIALALVNAREGRLKNGFAFAGSNAYRVNEIISVKELIDSLKEEYLACA
jgi:nitronate monooxygenase